MRVKDIKLQYPNILLQLETPDQETTPGGIVVTPGDIDYRIGTVVLSYEKDPEGKECPFTPGDIVHFKPGGTLPFPFSFEDSTDLALTQIDDILCGLEYE